MEFYHVQLTTSRTLGLFPICSKWWPHLRHSHIIYKGGLLFPLEGFLLYSAILKSNPVSHRWDTVVKLTTQYPAYHFCLFCGIAYVTVASHLLLLDSGFELDDVTVLIARARVYQSFAVFLNLPGGGAQRQARSMIIRKIGSESCTVDIALCTLVNSG